MYVHIVAVTVQCIDVMLAAVSGDTHTTHSGPNRLLPYILYVTAVDYSPAERYILHHIGFIVPQFQVTAIFKWPKTEPSLPCPPSVPPIVPHLLIYTMNNMAAIGGIPGLMYMCRRVCD